MPEPPTPKLIFLSAGEASGDHYGAQMIDALHEALPSARFTGLGGLEMDAAGQQRIVRAEDVAHMGITEVIRHMPKVYAAYRSLVASIRRQRPALAILIDFPDVNFRLARHLRNLNIPVIWFVSPQLWAWKRRRLRWVQQRVSKMLVIFPFEEQFYRARGVDAEFVGHPLAELPLPTISREEYATRHGLDPGKYWIALLPGSREREVRANLYEMIGMTMHLSLDCEYLIPVASTINGSRLEEAVREQIRSRQMEVDSSLQAPQITLVSDAREALHHARASVVASGTATLQAALTGNPFVVVYRVSFLTFRMARRLVLYPAEIPAQYDEHGNLPIAMVNLIAGRRIVPELIQDQFSAKNLAKSLQPMLEDTPVRRQIILDLAEVRGKLTLPPGTPTSIHRLRDAALALLHLR